MRRCRRGWTGGGGLLPLACLHEGPGGYAYANTLMGRRGYDRNAETTVYVRQDSGRQGVGGALYTTLLDMLKERGFHTAIGRGEGGSFDSNISP